MRHASLFSGIGGFDLAAEWMGWENVFHCDINPFGKKVLEYYYPNSISYGDITKTDFSIHRGDIDILTGGFPCQPYSLAGKRKGKEDERHLFPEMLRAIREIQPRWIIGENVYGLVNWDGGLLFHEVQSDLEAEGYEVFPYVLPACSINAPHRRERVFFVAYAESSRGSRGGNSGDSGESVCEKERFGLWNQFDNDGEDGTTTDSYRFGCGGRNKQSQSDNSKERKIHKNEQQYRNGVWSKTEGCNTSVTDSCCERLQRSEINGDITKEERKREYDRNITRQISNKWENFPTVSPICDGDDGISDRLDSITFSKWRNESIKAGGNAIVPQVVYQIFKAIQEYERINNSR